MNIIYTLLLILILLCFNIREHFHPCKPTGNKCEINVADDKDSNRFNCPLFRVDANSQGSGGSVEHSPNDPLADKGFIWGENGKPTMLKFNIKNTEEIEKIKTDRRLKDPSYITNHTEFETKCMMCKAGCKISKKGCQPCQQNYFSKYINSMGCTPCPTGYVTHIEGATSCVKDKPNITKVR